MADSPAAVEFREVTKRFADAAAVDRVSFAIARGTLVTLLGPSGCGKTTTLRLIAGLETPSDGTILIGGEDVTRLPVTHRDIAMVFQSYALFPHLNVLDNVAFGLRNIGHSSSQARAAAAEGLDLVGLKGYEARMTGQLSGGQQQRVAVARAIVLRPKVLLLDEPLSNLDARLRRQVRDDIRALQQRLSLTVVYVTHDQQEALAVSDQVIVMSAGRIAQMDTPEGLYDAPANRFVADFIGEANILPATISEISDGTAAIHLGRAVLRLADRGRRPGQVELALRPGAIVLGPKGDPDAVLDGTILRSAYLGDSVEYLVRTELGDLHVVDHRRTPCLPPNAEVGLRIDPAGATVLLD